VAITIQAQLAKKVPIPGASFSSQQASITISAEVIDLNQIVAEAQRLYALAEQAVDAQLAGQRVTPEATPAALPARDVSSSASRSSPSTGSQPYRGNTPWRAPAVVTDSQLRFLKRLIDQTKAPLAGICEQYQIGDISQLSCRDAAALIDELKQVSS
jgi:hypothetical protein